MGSSRPAAAASPEGFAQNAEEPMSNATIPAHCSTLSRYRVIVAETDMMSIVHHANYVLYLERGRLDYMRRRGLTYKQLVAQGLHLAIVDLTISYKKPAHFDDLLLIETRFAQLSRVTLGFEYSVYRLDEEALGNKTLLTRASTRQACIDGAGRPRPLPPRVIKHLRAPESLPH